jgi:hypothetical protein
MRNRHDYGVGALLTQAIPDGEYGLIASRGLIDYLGKRRFTGLAAASIRAEVPLVSDGAAGG